MKKELANSDLKIQDAPKIKMAFGRLPKEDDDAYFNETLLIDEILEAEDNGAK